MHPQPILKADLFAPTTLQSTAYMFHRKTPQKKWKCLKNQAVEDWGLSKMFSFCGFWNEVSRFFLRIHVDAQDNYTIYRHRILRCALGSFWYLTPIYTSCVFFQQLARIYWRLPSLWACEPKGCRVKWNTSLLQVAVIVSSIQKWYQQEINWISFEIFFFQKEQFVVWVPSVILVSKAPDLTLEISHGEMESAPPKIVLK